MRLGYVIMADSGGSAFLHCRVEQLVACQAHNLEVGGSIPPPATKQRICNITK